LACQTSTKVVDLLLAAGASLHSHCLHLAAYHSTEDDEFQPQILPILSHLLDLGMDINGMAEMRWSDGRGNAFFAPLHAAVMADSSEVILFLLERGANKNIRSTAGETPLEMAIRNDRKAAIKALHPGIRRSARLSGA
jgi:ankyrin repeat protein